MLPRPKCKAQTLRLVVAMHEVLVRGHSLRQIETAMQRLELSFPAALPANQPSLIPRSQPVIFEIVVTEFKDAEKRAQALQESGTSRQSF